MQSETRERFLRAIAERLGAEQIVEAHLFPAIRQGLIESGVAVIASHAPAAVTPNSTDVTDASTDEAPADDAPADDAPADEAPADAARQDIHTATYRFTRKGPERGKWAFDVVAEATAPLATLETVVRGVRERSGEGFEVERLTGDDFRSLLPLGSSAPSAAA